LIKASNGVFYRLELRLAPNAISRRLAETSAAKPFLDAIASPAANMKIAIIDFTVDTSSGGRLEGIVTLSNGLF
jgi:hypothetical protein